MHYDYFMKHASQTLAAKLAAEAATPAAEGPALVRPSIYLSFPARVLPFVLLSFAIACASSVVIVFGL